MKKTVFTFLFCIGSLLASEPSLMEKLDQLSIDRFTNKSCQVFEPIDFLYMINLDKRPEKWQESLRQLKPFGLVPFRFSAVDAFNMSSEELNFFGNTFTEQSKKNLLCTRFEGKAADYVSKIANQIGQKYFIFGISRGAVGCSVSHLSVWLDAFKSGYDMIWVMEDDVKVVNDPAMLQDLINELDELTNKDWDILFTNPGFRNNEGGVTLNTGMDHRHMNLNTRGWQIKNLSVSKNFNYIEARFGTCSYIVKRSGLIKLMDFYSRYNPFYPIDIEMSYITKNNNLKIYETKLEIITNITNALSDNR